VQDTFPDIETERIAVGAAMECRGVFTRNVKAEVLRNLPGREFLEIIVDLSADQQRRYDEILAGLVEDVRDTDEHEFQRRLPHFLQRRTALLQVCSNPAGVDEHYSETPGKLTALDVLIDDYLALGEKVVVWSYYRASISAIVARYGDRGLVRIDGSVADTADRRTAVQRFQTDDSIRIFVGNPAAAGAGLTLHAARVAIYESLSNQAAHHMQSLDRIHRRGQARDVTYLTLLARDTIEQGEYDRLLTKAQRQGVLLGDPSNTPVSRTAFLADLHVRA